MSAYTGHDKMPSILQCFDGAGHGLNLDPDVIRAGRDPLSLDTGQHKYC